jgi:hypothetical protein
MLTYDRILSLGNFFPLDIKCDTKKIMSQISQFEFKQYNTLKPENNRQALSITKFPQDDNSIDLESFEEWNRLHGTNYNENDCNERTNVYYASSEIQNLTKKFDDYLGRCHFLKMNKGSYFPPHRDCHHDLVTGEQESFRLIVPLHQCYPPFLYFMQSENVLRFEEGRMYFLNTNMQHHLFSYSDYSLLMVLNIQCNEHSLYTLTENLLEV